jgi:putative oxidoreductase
MFAVAQSDHGREKISDWVLRFGVALSFLLFGFEKFPSGPTAQWVRFFDQVGLGQWFRYFTGVVEIAGGALVLFPATSRIGLGILGLTMAVASVIHIFIMHEPANVIVTGGLCVGLMALWRRLRES